jgi:hypothetical protein
MLVSNLAFARNANPMPRESIASNGDLVWATPKRDGISCALNAEGNCLTKIFRQKFKRCASVAHLDRLPSINVIEELIEI